MNLKSKIKRVLVTGRRRMEDAVLSLAHAGGERLGVPPLRYFCPTCERRVFRFRRLRRIVGRGKTRPEPGRRICPHCGSLERTRHFTLYLRRSDILEGRPRMLHFAPEKGLENYLRPILGDAYVTTDLFMEGVDRKEDITAMSFGDNSFDLIYCSNVLEHIPDDKAAMAELFRVLAPGGQAIVQVPIRGAITYEDEGITDPVERLRHFGQADHVRYYGEDISMRLEAAGFDVEPFHFPDLLGLEPGELLRMNMARRELIHRCRKPV